MRFGIYASRHLYVYADAPVCWYAGSHAHMYGNMHVSLAAACPCVHVCMCPCMYISIMHPKGMYVYIIYCMCVYVTLYIYIYIHTYCVFPAAEHLHIRMCHHFSPRSPIYPGSTDQGVRADPKGSRAVPDGGVIGAKGHKTRSATSSRRGPGVQTLVGDHIH